MDFFFWSVIGVISVAVFCLVCFYFNLLVCELDQSAAMHIMRHRAWFPASRIAAVEDWCERCFMSRLTYITQHLRELVNSNTSSRGTPDQLLRELGQSLDASHPLYLSNATLRDAGYLLFARWHIETSYPDYAAAYLRLVRNEDEVKSLAKEHASLLFRVDELRTAGVGPSSHGKGGRAIAIPGLVIVRSSPPPKVA